MNIDQRLKSMRQQLGLSLREVARNTGISPATILRAEKGIGEIGYWRMHTILDFYRRFYEINHG
ncbi:MAG: helix-turn-helix transcriptional regulator [Selenomonadales bacterium]|nr:helix-turn-helix transcriptional regulator [Selenomonadales bacterium]